LRAVLVRCARGDVNVIARNVLDELASVDGPVVVLTGPGVVLRGVVVKLVDIEGLKALVDLLGRGRSVVAVGRGRQRHHEAASSPRGSLHDEVAVHLSRQLARGVKAQP
jgi:hypothetical protein